MGRYFLSSVAESDMLAIWEYIANDNIFAADRMIDRFTAAFERAAAFQKLAKNMRTRKASSASLSSAHI